MSLLAILLCLFGLGIVIFVHELGHFAVAKWAGVYVERFSIGFGPKLLAFKKGETEYCLSILPFGGYVKMLGENPDEEPTTDPRAYRNKSVPARMAIISAGVIMNIIFGFFAFLLIFHLGVPYTPPVIGQIVPGKSAWEWGLQRGDKVLQIDGERIIEFEEIRQRTLLSNPNAPEGSNLKFTVERNGTNVTLTVPTRMGSYGPEIGIIPSRSLLVPPSRAPTEEEKKKLESGDQPFDFEEIRKGGTILEVDGVPISSNSEFMNYLARNPTNPITLLLDRDGTQVETVLPANHFRDLGLSFESPFITGIQPGSPATEARDKDGELAPLQLEDRIRGVKVNGELLPINMLRLSTVMAEMAQKKAPVILVISRVGQGEEDIELTVEPEDIPGWITPPSLDEYGAINTGAPLTVPALGIAFQIRFPRLVLDPEEGTPGALMKLKQGDLILGCRMVDPRQEEQNEYTPIDEDNPNFGEFFWLMQFQPTSLVQLRYKRGDKEYETKPVAPAIVDDWFCPIRGIPLGPLKGRLTSSSLSESISLGYRTTRNTLLMIYLSLHRLGISQTIPPKNLSGPLGIAQMAYRVAEADLMLLVKFLAMLSINLAVINFLPIPILDGGHMVFLIWEGVRGKPASEKAIGAANLLGMFVIISLAVFVTYQDVLRWLSS